MFFVVVDFLFYTLYPFWVDETHFGRSRRSAEFTKLLAIQVNSHKSLHQEKDIYCLQVLNYSSIKQQRPPPTHEIGKPVWIYVGLIYFHCFLPI